MGKVFFVFLLFLIQVLIQAAFLHAVDVDNDGLEDSLEDTLAEEFLPLIYFTEEEQCPGPGVILYHVRPFAPGVDTILSVSYALLFYDDCGGAAHKGDSESFCLTLFEDASCPLGYRAHSIRTFAHPGIPLCEYVSTMTIDRCDFGSSAGDAIYVSQNKHALYKGLIVCNSPFRLFCEDECEMGLLMYNGSLIFPEAGQSWYMFNVGEPDYPFIEDLSELGGGNIDFSPLEVWDYCHFCGDEAFFPGDYCPATIVNDLFRCSSGPSLPVEISFDAGGAVPSPMGYCRDQFLYLNLPYGGNVTAHLYSITGDVTDKVYLPYFCGTDELKTPYWDGGNMDGYCASPGNYYLIAEAQRGDSHAQTEPLRFGITGDEGRPNSPTGLNGTGNSYSVSISWTDHSSVEDAFVVERSFDTCPYRVVAVLPANSTSWSDAPLYEGIARYRVAAHRTLGGNSEYSNELLMNLRWDPTVPVLSGIEAVNPHRHQLSWLFNPGGVAFGHYSLYKRYRIPMSFCESGGIPPNWSSWCNIYDCFDPLNTVYVDSALIDGNCYEYMVSAVITDPADTLFSNTMNFHGYCDGQGCPVLFIVHDQLELRLTNLLPLCEISEQAGRSRLKSSRAADIVDVVYVGGDLVDDDGMITLKIEEVSEDTTFIDNIDLLSVVLPYGISAGISTTGVITGYRNEIRPFFAEAADGVDVMDLVSMPDDSSYRGRSGDVLIVEFDRADDTDSLFGMFVQIEDPTVKAIGPVVWIWKNDEGEGGWNKVCTVYPHQNRSARLVSLSGHIGEDQRTVRLKLERLNHLSLDHLFLTSEFDLAASVSKLELVRAVSDEGVDVSPLTAHADEVRVVLEKAESISLYYRKPPGNSKGTEYYLEIRGHYVKGDTCGKHTITAGQNFDIDTPEAR
jgi:hypothetical protein